MEMTESWTAQRERMVHKIMRHAEVEVFGARSVGSQLGLFAPACAAGARDGHGRFRRRSRELRYLVTEAYLSMFRVLPEDHVVADPLLNVEFVQRCRELGALDAEEVLNRSLLNARKAGAHAGMEREVVSPLNPGAVDRIAAATELAARMTQFAVVMERGESPSVDRILCNPGYRELFDEYAASIVPDVPVRDFRLVLLGFRKAARVPGASMEIPPGVFAAKPERLDRVLSRVQAVPGIYRLWTGRRREFISWTSNLERRLNQHAAIADGRLVPPGWRTGLDQIVAADVYPMEDARRTMMEGVVRIGKIDQCPRWNIPLAG